MGTELTIAEQKELASTMAASRLLPDAYIGKPENVFVAIEYGKALGLPPIEAINSVNVIKGKPSMSANLMAALVRRAGCKLRITSEGEGEQTRVTAVLIRPDDPDFEFKVVWDKAKAMRAGVWGSNTWRTYPDQMLRNRAITEICRTAANDFLMGVVYDPEELGGVPASPSGVSAVQVSGDDDAAVQVSSVTVEPAPVPFSFAGAGQQPTETDGEQVDVEDVVVVDEDHVGAVYETAERLGYDQERLAKGCMWASNGATNIPDELTAEQAGRLVSKMLAMATETEGAEA